MDGTYKLTGFTGSIPYMSPEVAKSLPYNLSADVLQAYPKQVITPLRMISMARQKSFQKEISRVELPNCKVYTIQINIPFNNRNNLV